MSKYQCCGAGAAFFRLVPVLTQFGRSRLRDLGLSEPPKKIGGSTTMVFTQDVYDCTAKNATDVYNGQLDIQIFGRDSNGQYSIIRWLAPEPLLRGGTDSDSTNRKSKKMVNY